MKKFKMILIILLGVILFIGLHSNSLSGQETNEVPKIFQLNPSLDFNKEEIKEWVDEYSWEKANSLTRKSHTRINEEELTYARFYTPIMFWVEKNFMGEQRFWSKEKIKKEYENLIIGSRELAFYLNEKRFLDLSDIFLSSYHQLNKMIEQYYQTIDAWSEVKSKIKKEECELNETSFS